METWYLFSFLWFYVMAEEPETTGYPRLLIGPDKVALLKKHWRDKTYGDKFDQLIQAWNAMSASPKVYLSPEKEEVFRASWNEIFGNSLPPLALYQLLNGDSESFGLVKQSLDRYSNYSSWYPANVEGLDEVPNAHHVTGFAISLDFLYNSFSQSDLDKYYNTLFKQALIMYRKAQFSPCTLPRVSGISGRDRCNMMHGWGHQYVHNHAGNNGVALYVAGLVLEQQLGRIKFEDEESELILNKIIKIKNAGIMICDRALTILENVVDGSLEEGAAYGSYTSRALFTYLYLAKRHMNKDYSNHPWLTRQFRFYKATAVKNYKWAMGYPDSNLNWFYGPEAQLYFLDSYIHRTGEPTWLAQQIRNASSERIQGASQKYSMVHFEVIWRDPTILPKQPINDPTMEIFSDWGVVTSSKGGSTLSMKCGAIGGRAMHEMAFSKETPPYSWLSNPPARDFNFGHEHPDAGTFIYIPELDKPVITTSLYGPKWSHLQNTIEFHQPDLEQACGKTHIGLLGDFGTCSKWLSQLELPESRADLIYAVEHENVTFISAQMVKAYDSKWKIKSADRQLLAFDDFLFISDSIVLHPESNITSMSSYFHNIMNEWETGPKGGIINDYELLQLYPEVANCQKHFEIIPAEYKTRNSSFLNMTNPIEHHAASQLFVVKKKATQMNLLNYIVEPSGIRIELEASKARYDINLATSLVASTRRDFLGHAGVATIKSPDGVINVGSNDGYSLSSSQLNIDPMATTILVIVMVVCNLCVIGASRQFVSSCKNGRRKFFHLASTIVIILMLFWQLIWLKYRRQNATSYEPDSTSSKTTEVILIISSLVGSGSQLLKPMFHNSNQWTYIEQLSIKKDSIYEILGTLELEHATDTQKELILVNGHFGSVNYKLLPTFAETTILIDFIRDPRSWINAVMWQNELSEEDRTELVTKLIDYHIGDLKSNYTEWLQSTDITNKNQTQIKMLSLVWKMNAVNIIEQEDYSPPRVSKIVKMEDLFEDSQLFFVQIQRLIGVPLTVKQMHDLEYTIRSGHYSTTFDQNLNLKTPNNWEHDLSSSDIDLIESICHSEMAELGYAHSQLAN